MNTQKPFDRADLPKEACLFTLLQYFPKNKSKANQKLTWSVYVIGYCKIMMKISNNMILHKLFQTF